MIHVIPYRILESLDHKLNYKLELENLGEKWASDMIEDGFSF